MEKNAIEAALVQYATCEYLCCQVSEGTGYEAISVLKSSHSRV